MRLKRAFMMAALWFAGSALGASRVAAQDEVFVAQDGVNTGSIGAYDISFGSGSASGSTINSALITSPAAGQSTEVRMSLATDGQGDLFVGEYSGGTTATIGEYSLNGTAINSSFLTLSDSSGVPQLAADGQGHLFVAVGNTVSEYNTGGTLLNSFSVGPIATAVNLSALAVDSSDDLYTAYTTGNPLEGLAYHGVVGEYNASGSSISKSLITTPNFINALTVGGGDIYVSILDGPPDIETRIDEYTTSGSEVMSPFIFGVGGHTALDGQGHLLVDSYGDGTINAYTASGDLLASDVVSGAGGAEDMVIIPVPEPSAFALLAMGAAGLFIRRHS
jgi:hypothetical protein